MSGNNGHGGNGKAHPLPKGDNGRDEKGRYVNGHAGGPGNPYARKVAAFRNALWNAAEPERDNLARVLVNAALEGKPWAMRELWDRLMGKAKQTVDFRDVTPDGDPFEVLTDPEVTGALERAIARGPKSR